uniref:Uncharacterized protein n=1 Tax=Rhizophora mucronata TaxID=61149 RepID=A0A2P2P6Q5_RHIMU
MKGIRIIQLGSCHLRHQCLGGPLLDLNPFMLSLVSK